MRIAPVLISAFLAATPVIALAESMADELRANAKSLLMENDAPGLGQTPLLALTADDGLASHTNALVQAIEAGGGHGKS
jgi:hypothetical protein